MPPAHGKTKAELAEAERKRQKQQRKRKRNNETRKHDDAKPDAKPRTKQCNTTAAADRPVASGGRRVQLRVCWIGTDYCGWQTQGDGQSGDTSLHQILSEAMFKVTGEANVDAAGRTDKGVHAANQCVQVVFRRSTSTVDPVDTLAARLNTQLLNTQVQVKSAQQMEDSWTHKFATGKRYCYYILDGACTDEQHATDAADEVHANDWSHMALVLDCQTNQKKLNIKRMNKAAADLVGTHDFRELSSIKPSVVSSTRSLTKATVELVQNHQYPFAGTLEASAVRAAPGFSRARLIRITLEGKGFLKHMVRRCAGLLMRVGQGQEKSSVTADAVAMNRTDEDSSFTRKQAPVAPACGLWLDDVFFTDVGNCDST